MTFVQLVRPGAPVVLGSFASSMSMQSGAPTFGTPEPALVLYVDGRARPPARRPVPLRRHPLRLEDRRRPGGLRVGRTRFSRRSSAGVNFVLHAAGWLEGGLAVGYEKFILDADQCGMARGLRQGRRPVRERPGARRDPRERARASTSSAAPTRWPTSRPPSTAPRSPTTTASSSGRRTARSTPPSGPTRSGSGCSPSTRRRRSIPAIDEALLDFIARRKASMPDSEV